MFEDDHLVMYRSIYTGRDQEVFAGIIEDSDSFLCTLSKLPHKKIRWTESQGDIYGYGIIYFRKNGIVFHYPTENIFNADELTTVE